MHNDNLWVSRNVATITCGIAQYGSIPAMFSRGPKRPPSSPALKT